MLSCRTSALGLFGRQWRPPAAQWWTFGNTGAFAAIGLQGLYIYIDPPTRTAVVKLSYVPPGDNSALDAESSAIPRTVSRWKPN